MSTERKLGGNKMTLTLSSTAFTTGGEIPSKYTCERDDVSPALEWTGVPDQTRSLVLIVDDPDAPDPRAPKMTWVHWVLYNIPPDTTGLPEGATSADLPNGTKEGMNDWKRTGYGGPCPPSGTHRYFFKAYAYAEPLGLEEPPSSDDLLAALKGRVLDEAALMGNYSRRL